MLRIGDEGKAEEDKECAGFKHKHVLLGVGAHLAMGSCQMVPL